MAQLMSTAAWAQTAPAVVEAGSSVSDADNTSIAEIVVTAKKRVERLQDVPLAVNVATSDQLKEAGIQNAEALGTIVPGLNVSQTTGGARSEGRRVGKECGSTCRSRWSRYD